MAYGKISFEVEERSLVEGLLQNAIISNATLLERAQDDSEAKFYMGVRPILQSCLNAVQQNSLETSLSENQLKMLRGLLSASFPEFREMYQKARESNMPNLESLKRQWAIRDNLVKKFDAPFVADTSCDAEGESSDED